MRSNSALGTGPFGVGSGSRLRRSVSCSIRFNLGQLLHEAAISDETAAAVDGDLERSADWTDSCDRPDLVPELSPYVLETDTVTDGECRHHLVALHRVVEGSQHGEECSEFAAVELLAGAPGFAGPRHGHQVEELVLEILI